MVPGVLKCAKQYGPKERLPERFWQSQISEVSRPPAL